MNDIIWLLYLADVAYSVKMLCGMSSLVLVVVVLLYMADCHSDKEIQAAKPTARKGLMLAGVCLLFAVIIPNKQVIYAMAAAKVAEEPRVQATATKALDALDAWLDKQIEEKKGD